MSEETTMNGVRFKPEEIVKMERKNKKTGETTVRYFPVVGGRLRLYHEDLQEHKWEHAGIETDIHTYDGDLAVVTAKVRINGAVYSGIGMSNKKRDSLIHPAVLEMAETRAIARALRFAGYGVEYTGAEEMALEMLYSDSNADTVKSESKKAKASPPVPSAGKDETSLKSALWKKIIAEYRPDNPKNLGSHVKSFMNDMVKKYREQGTEVPLEQAYKVCLDNWDEFKRSFDKFMSTPTPNLDPDPIKEPVPERKEYQEKKEAVAEKMNVSPSTVSADPESRKAKAKIFMNMPDGTNVGALNSTLEELIDANDIPTIDLYNAILKDMDTFVGVLVDHCAKNGIDPGLKVSPNAETKEKVEQKDAPPPERNKKEYSDFRKSWNNLGWKDFNAFILRSQAEFRADQAEYDAAVKKYDRLKVKNEAAEMCFPFPFSFEEPEVLQSDKSILDIGIVERQSKLSQIFTSYPKMCKKTGEVCGISIPENDEEAVVFLEEYDHLIQTYEVKNGKPYTE